METHPCVSCAALHPHMRTVTTSFQKSPTLLFTIYFNVGEGRKTSVFLARKIPCLRKRGKMIKEGGQSVNMNVEGVWAGRGEPSRQARHPQRVRDDGRCPPRNRHEGHRGTSRGGVQALAVSGLPPGRWRGARRTLLVAGEAGAVGAWQRRPPAMRRDGESACPAVSMRMVGRKCLLRVGRSVAAPRLPRLPRAALDR